jgi:hypothetical protein
MLILILIVPAISAKAQSIPAISGETIDNKSIHFPEDLKGKFSLLCFATSQKAQTDLETWMDPVYQKFIAKTGLMDDMYDVNVYFIPVLTGANRSFASTMKKKFKETAQDDLKSHVLFYNADGENILSALKMQKSDEPYFFLLDKDANIIYRTKGKYTEEKFDKIDDLIEL